MKENTKEFKRETRYFVFKIKNLTGEQLQRLYDLQMELGHKNGMKPCVVVEHDWPEYEHVWRMIEARVTGKSDEDCAARRCNLGVGCIEAGTCYAAAHGRPDKCGRE